MYFKHCFVVATIGVLCAQSGVAEVGCKADLSYSWKRSADGVESKALFRTIEVVGSDEAVAKQLLQESLTRERPRALISCRDRHENITECVATRFAQHQTTLSGMSFSARRALEDAIKSDCQSVQGVCGEVSTGEVTCAERVNVAVASPVAADTKDEKPKEKESKKK